jgi:hypothetical protein
VSDLHVVLGGVHGKLVLAERPAVVWYLGTYTVVMIGKTSLDRRRGLFYASRHVTASNKEGVWLIVTY